MVNQPVLIVDDEVEMRIAMSETLKHCGYPVEISHNAIDALKKFKQNEYSLVITDMTMPKRSGLELLKDIKSISPAKPVIHGHRIRNCRNSGGSYETRRVRLYPQTNKF